MENAQDILRELETYLKLLETRPVVYEGRMEDVMKLWIYWMDNDYNRHYEERELPDDGGDDYVDFQDASHMLHCKFNNGQIKDYQVELRYSNGQSKDYRRAWE